MPILTDVPGDVPAEARLVVTDNASQDRWHVEWGAQTGSAAEVAKDLLLSQPDLTNTGFSGTSTTRSGSYSTNVYRGTLTNSAFITVCGTGAKTNIGTYRVRARVYAAGTGSYSVRLAWRDGDGPLTRNAINYALDDQWTDLDLGTINISEAPSGTQSWQGRIEAKSQTVGDTLDVDIIYLIPTSAGYGLARRPIAVPALTSVTARSEFTTESGAITGDSLSVGGTWAGAGDADDFSASGGVCTRTAVSDTATGIGSGRLVTASGTSAMTNTFASLDLKTSNAGASGAQGLLLRYVDSSNFLSVVATWGSSSFVTVRKTIAGTDTQLAGFLPVGLGTPAADTTYTLQVVVDAGGRVLVWISGTFQGSTSDSTLATGGTLDDGKVGMVDWHPVATAATRTYDNFTVSPVEPDAVIFAGRTAEFRHNTAIRQNSAGTIYGSMPLYRGSRFFIPPSGDDGLQTRVVVKARRNDVEDAQDNVINDSTTVQVYYRPRYLTPR